MLLCCPFDALAMAATNFTDQNLGAGKYDSIRQGTYACLLLGIIYCAIYIVIARFGTQYLVLLFMNADEAVSYTHLCARFFLSKPQTEFAVWVFPCRFATSFLN